MFLEGLHRLEEMSEDELVAYLDRRLHGQTTSPQVVWSHGDVPEQFIEDAFALSVDPDFKIRLRRATERLLRLLDPSFERNLDYIQRVIYLAGAIRVDGGAELLRDLAFRPGISEMKVDGAHMNELALRTTLDFPGNQYWKGWDGYLGHSRFFDAAYMAMTLRGRQEGLDHLENYFRMADKTGLDDSVIELRLSGFIHQYFELNDPKLADIDTIIAKLHGQTRERIGRIKIRILPAGLPRPIVALHVRKTIKMDPEEMKRATTSGKVKRPLGWVASRDRAD